MVSETIFLFVFLSMLRGSRGIHLGSWNFIEGHCILHQKEEITLTIDIEQH